MNHALHFARGKHFDLSDDWFLSRIPEWRERQRSCEGRMRSEYQVGHREREDCVSDLRYKLDAADHHYREGLAECGLPHLFRRWRESHHYL